MTQKEYQLSEIARRIDRNQFERQGMLNKVTLIGRLGKDPEQRYTLKPCPFCGGNPTVYECDGRNGGCTVTGERIRADRAHPAHTNIGCDNCGFTFMESTTAEAIAAWNTRVERKGDR